nr:helix-turn-helix domain-containing protein [Sphingomonas sp. QA11]
MTGLSLRQVQRGCKRYFGPPSKVLARKYRALRGAVAMMHRDPELNEMLEEGFYSQSRVTREIKHFTGMTPRAFAEHPTGLNREIAKRIALERENPIRRNGAIT